MSSIFNRTSRVALTMQKRNRKMNGKRLQLLLLLLCVIHGTELNRYLPVAQLLTVSPGRHYSGPAVANATQVAFSPFTAHSTNSKQQSKLQIKTKPYPPQLPDHLLVARSIKGARLTASKQSETVQHLLAMSMPQKRGMQFNSRN